MYSLPKQATEATQTEGQPTKRECVPLQLVDGDGKKRYCYHGGKCRCANCETLRQRQKDNLDLRLNEFVPHSRLALEPPMRFAQPIQYRLEAYRVSPEMGMQLLEDHIMLRKNNPIYFLPEKYFRRDIRKAKLPEDKGTQTDIVLGEYGIDGCPCVDKSQCWDI